MMVRLAFLASTPSALHSFSPRVGLEERSQIHVAPSHSGTFTSKSAASSSEIPVYIEAHLYLSLCFSGRDDEAIEALLRLCGGIRRLEGFLPAVEDTKDRRNHI